MTDSIDDPFIQELLSKFGANGYLAWFGLIEIICKENKNNITGLLVVSPTFLKQKFHIGKAVKLTEHEISAFGLLTWFVDKVVKPF